VLIGVEADLGSVPPVYGGGESSTEVLQLVVEKMNVARSAIVGVITAAA